MRRRFQRAATLVVNTAVFEAEERGDPMIGTEHLLVALATAPEVRHFLAGLGVTDADVRSVLAARDASALASVGVDVTPDLVSRPARSGRRRHRPFSAGARRTLERAVDEARLLRHRRIGAEHLLLAMTASGPADPAVDVLRRLGVDEQAVRRELLVRLRAA